LQEFSDIVKMDSMKLFKRQTNGVYYVRLARGKERSLKTKDKALAEQIFRKLKKEILMGKIIALDKGAVVTLKDFKKSYLETRMPVVAKSTYRADRLALDKLIEHLGNIPLQHITKKKLDTWHADFLRMGGKAVSLNVHIRHLKSAFTTAVEWGHVATSVYKSVKEFDEEERVPNFLKNDKEFHDLFAAIDDPDFATMVKFYVYTGCRRAELVRLEWPDMLVVDDFMIIKKTKGKKIKVLPISKELREVLDSMERKEKGYVFPRWRSPDTISHMFEEYRDKAGLTLRLHDLRHTTGSYLAKKGVSQKMIQEILGHTQMSTSDIYTHLFPEHLREALDKLDFAGKMQAGTDSNVISIEDKRTK
jgi:integrase